MADGDGRYRALAWPRPCSTSPRPKPLDAAEMGRVLQKRSPAYDKDREEHYNLISALHKSVRGSDPDAALYWLARMLDGGEDPLFIARRLVRMAVGGHRRGRPAVAGARDRGQGRLRLPGLARGRAGAGAGWSCTWPPRPSPTPSSRAFGAAMRSAEGDRLADAAGPHPQRPDPADEGARLRQGLRLRPRRPRKASPARTTSRTASSGGSSTRPKGEGAEARIKERLERWAALRDQKGGK